MTTSSKDVGKPHVDSNAAKQFATDLSAGDETIHRAYKAGTPVANLVQMRVALLDRLLLQLWHDHFAPAAELSLVAVGGYGRGELHPYSDVDLLILVSASLTVEHQTALETLLRVLWDAGLDIGHSVRTPLQCRELAAADVEIVTTLMETRCLAGDAGLYQQMLQLTDKHNIWPIADYFQAKLEEQQQRHLKYHDTAYKLEPNIKESPGGLRDIQTIAWVAKRHFNANSLTELQIQGFLTARELKELLAGQQFLWKVRYLLHRHCNRREDRLLFDHQRDIAHAFGYLDDTKNLAIEQFMQRYYRTVSRLQLLNELLLQLFKEAILLSNEKSESVPLGEFFTIGKGVIDVVDHNVFKQHPPALFEIFMHLAKHQEIQNISARTIRLIRENLYLVDETFRNDKRVHRLFIGILKQPFGITHNLRRMSRYGLLAAYLPVFGRIAGRMQYDLFHIYTVDEHTLFVIRNMRRMFLTEHQEELPLCSTLAATISKPELLYLAGFFHDIGKGRGGDHSKIGAQEVRDFCTKHDVNEIDSELIEWLVKNHLLMSATAQRKDISDPAVIHEFAKLVKNQNHLIYLFLLTIADIRGTNPELWNGWKNSLLTDLFHKTTTALERGLENPVQEPEEISETRHEAMAKLSELNVDTSKANEIWKQLGKQYFLRHNPEEIAWHTHALLQQPSREMPLTLTRQNPQKGATELFIVVKDHDNLFALVTAVLDQLGTNVVDARITTTDENWAFDTFLILEANGERITSAQRLDDICSALQLALKTPEKLPKLSVRRIPRKLRHFNIPLKVRIIDNSGPCSTVEVIATDYPGLLARLGRTFAKLLLRVHSARIITVGEKVEDLFVLSDQHNKSLTATSLKQLTSAIAKELKTGKA